ncbi:hypothetical protein [Halopenitus persicus]|uniref:hypothetical protein n=1 Tax=Halopenitus persicus TaxID=1048396 RepID=UPI000BBACAC6|nr:hypothetical protein [Halopenitus persicus]
MSDPDAASGAVSDAADDESEASEGGPVRVWLVERTYSDDEQNMVILVYATPDGTRYFRKERALTSFTDVRDTTAAVAVDPGNLGAVDEPDRRERYADEAARMAAAHDPDDVV